MAIRGLLAENPFQSVASPSIGQRAKGLISTLLGANNDQELQRGLINFGTNMLQAGAPDTPWGGSFAGALGQALPATRQGLEADREEAAMMAALPEPYRALGPLLGPQAYAQMIGRVAPVGAGVYDPAAGGWVTPSPAGEGGWSPSAVVEQAYTVAGAPLALGPEELKAQMPEVFKQVQEYLTAYNQRSGTTVNVGGGAFGDALNMIAAERGDVESAAQALPLLSTAYEMTQTPEFEQTAGTGGTVYQFLDGVAARLGSESSAERRSISDATIRFIKNISVDELRKYGAGSGLSDRDLQEAQANLGGNIEMEPEAIRALLYVAMQTRQDKVNQYNTRLGMLGPYFEQNDAAGLAPFYRVTIPSSFTMPGETPGILPGARGPGGGLQPIPGFGGAGKPVGGG